MSPLSRKLLRYAAPAALFACGVAVLVAGWPAAFAWTLIVVSLVGVAQRANAPRAGTPSDPVSDHRADGGERGLAEDRLHPGESRRSLSCQR
jgi:hypothetical protein